MIVMDVSKTMPIQNWGDAMDGAKLNEFIGRVLGDLGGALSVPLVRIGDRLGLYKALHTEGPMTPDELAMNADIAERYAREWLSQQAASGYLEYNKANGKFTLPPEQAMVFAEASYAVSLPLMETVCAWSPGVACGSGVWVAVAEDWEDGVCP